jgi:hypothetical protein
MRTYAPIYAFRTVTGIQFPPDILCSIDVSSIYFRLQTAVVKAINKLLANKEPFISTLQKNITTIFNEENDNATDDIDSKMEFKSSIEIDIEN